MPVRGPIDAAFWCDRFVCAPTEPNKIVAKNEPNRILYLFPFQVNDDDALPNELENYCQSVSDLSIRTERPKHHQS